MGRAATASLSPSSTLTVGGRAGGGGGGGGGRGGNRGGFVGGGGDGRIPQGPTDPLLGGTVGNPICPAPEVTAAALTGDHGGPLASVWELLVVALQLLTEELRSATAEARSV